MFGRIVWRSLVTSRARFAVALAAVAVPAALVTAVANFALDAEAKMTRELRAHGPNVILEARRGAAGMDSAELDRALSSLPRFAGDGGGGRRTPRLEISIAAPIEEIEPAIRKINETSRTLQARTIPVIQAREGAILGRLRGLLGWITVFIVVAGGVALAMTLGAGVVERRAEIGLLKALGAPHGQVVRLFTAQVGLLLAIGLSAGAGAGVLVSGLMIRGVFGVAGDFRPSAVAGAAAACAAMALGASVVPVRRALAVEPAAVLKGE